MAATLDAYLSEIECYPTWERRAWYQKLWDAAIKSVEVAPSASNNTASLAIAARELLAIMDRDFCVVDVDPVVKQLRDALQQQA